MVSPQSSRLDLKSKKQLLLGQYDQLKHYAISLNSDVAPVKIRLERAREAAEAFDEAKFEKLAHGIFLTLEERYNKIAAARKDVPGFRTPSPSPEPESESESMSSQDSLASFEI